MAQQIPDQSALLARLRRHDERAFNDLVHHYQRRVFTVVFRMVGDREEAEDLTQEVFVQVFKAIGGFRGDAKLSTWIYRIAINLCKNRIKYRQRRHTSEHDPLVEDAGGATAGASTVQTSVTLQRPDQLYAGKQLEGAVHKALLGLEPEFREVIVLRELEGLAYDEIATITGVAPGTVKSRIHRARNQLRTAIEALMGGTIQ